MTYIVIENCIKCKHTDCVEVCPVDCFYEGENMLVIHPDECIDCGVCEPECPVDAIKPDTEPGLEKWLEINTKFADLWPVITLKKDGDPDAKKHDGEEGKLEKYFSEKPGEGDRRLAWPDVLASANPCSRAHLFWGVGIRRFFCYTKSITALLGVYSENYGRWASCAIWK